MDKKADVAVDQAFLFGWARPERIPAREVAELAGRGSA